MGLVVQRDAPTDQRVLPLETGKKKRKGVKQSRCLYPVSLQEPFSIQRDLTPLYRRDVNQRTEKRCQKPLWNSAKNPHSSGSSLSYESARILVQDK